MLGKWFGRMFVRGREQLPSPPEPGSRLAVLDVVRIFGTRACSYIQNGDWPNGVHDCKFGYVGEYEDEQSGCAELEQVARLLVRLTDEEWTEILSRSGPSASM